MILEVLVRDMRQWRERWSVRFAGALATIVIGVPVVTFGSVAYWNELTTSDTAIAAACAPNTYGIVVSGTRYTVEEFTDTSATCDWTVPTGVTEVEYLVVAGGGGGGSSYDGPGAGGGGAGGVILKTGADAVAAAPGSTISITVGEGGTGGGGTGSGTGDARWNVAGSNGSNSSFGADEAVGGGGGGGRTSSGLSGGSGGGAGGRSELSGGSGTPNQGFDGGSTSGDFKSGAGGGGSGGRGSEGISGSSGDPVEAGGDGGSGTTVTITGTAFDVAYGGDGGGFGGLEDGANGVEPGSGGGGGDGDFDTAGTGIGANGGDGSDGIVIVRYEAPASDRDWAMSADWTAGTGDGTGLSSAEYFEATGQVLDYTGTDGSVEAWVYFEPDQDTQYSVLGASKYMYISTWGQDRVVNSVPLDYPIRVGDSWTTDVEMPQGRWTHIAATWANTAASLYVDGQLAASTTGFISPGVDSTGTSKFRVGAIYDDPSTPSVPWITFWDGMIDEVRVWDDVRSVSEIRSGMHTAPSGLDLTDGNLRAYWDFNQSAGSTATSIGSVGSAATMTAVGTPTYTELAAGNSGSGSRSNWTVHEFERSYITAASGWAVPNGVQAAEVLVVGGGGGGGADNGGGGGGGGVFDGTVTLSPGVQPIVVGQGGVGTRYTGSSYVTGSSGQTSSAFGLTAGGGGLGGTADANITSAGAAGADGSAGGSGGGGASESPTDSWGSGGAGGNGDAEDNSDDGFSGGAGVQSNVGGGGGGGAGANGESADASLALGRPGGDGISSSIRGTIAYFGGGGGGGSENNVTERSAGGLGGGGRGATADSGVPGYGIGESGTPNSGGGAGGGTYNNAVPGGAPLAGGNGGSGVVIVAYLTDATARITDGLVVDLDVVNPNSHQGSSTAWTDLAGGDHNAVFHSAPTIIDGDASNPDRVDLAGSSAGDWASITTDLGDFTGGITIRVVGSFGSVKDNWERLVDIGEGQDQANIFLGREGGTNQLVVKQHAPGGGLTTACVSTAEAIDTSVHVWTATIDSAGNCALFRDDVQLSLAIDAPGRVASATRSTTYIGKSHWSADADTEGSIRSVQIYTRALSRPELLAMSTATSWAPTGSGDITIVASGGASEGSGWTLRDGRITPGGSAVSIDASEVATALTAGDLRIETSGSITIDSDISWSTTGSVLLLEAGNDVEIAADITASGSSSGMVLDAGGDWWIDIASDANVTLSGSTPVLNINGYSYDFVANATQFAAMTASGRYALAESFSASASTLSTALFQGAFTGTFEGLGNTVDGLTIRSSGGDGQYPLGLFAELRGATIRHLGITDIDIQTSSTKAGTSTATNSGSEFRIGALAGNSGDATMTSGYSAGAQETTVSRVWSTGSISTANNVPGTDTTSSGDRQKYFYAGGVIGSVNNGTLNLSASYSEVNVSSEGSFSQNLGLGGLIGDVGLNRMTDTAQTTSNSTQVLASVQQSYSTGSLVLGSYGAYWAVGGLIGVLFGSGHTLADSFSWSNIVGSGSAGGLVGFTLTADSGLRSYTTEATRGAASAPGTWASTAEINVTATSGTTLPTGFSSTVWAKNDGEMPYLIALGYPATPLYVLVTDDQTENAGSLTVEYSIVDGAGSAVDLAALGLTSPTGTAVFTIDNQTPAGTYEVSYLSGLTLGGANANRYTLRPSSTSGTVTVNSEPGQPTGLRAVPSGSSSTSVSMTWTGALSGATATDYKVEYSDNGGTSWVTFNDGVSTATSATVTGLTANTYYTFRVTAIAGTDEGTPSATSSTTSGLIPFPNGSDLGTGATTGFSHLYEDVLAGVDARLTATNVTVSGSGSVDVDTSALDGVFTDANFINTRLRASSSHHHVTYRVDFVDSSTGDPVTIENVIISVKDVDGVSGSSEYLEVAGITGYTLQSGADISVTQPVSGTYRFTGTAAQGVADPEGWAQVTYDSVSSVTLTVGNTTGGFARIPIAFGPVPYTSPVTTSVTRPTYTITYDANGGSGTVPTPTAGTSALTIADGTGLINGSRSFLRWNTLADGSGTSFSAGSVYTPSGDLTLFAVYQTTAAISWAPTTAISLNESPLTPDASPTFSGSGSLSYSVTSAGTTGCSVNSGTGELTFTDTGSCTVQASVSASGDYAADSVDVTFVISRVSQAITFADPADRVWSETATAINPTSDSGLTVSVSTSTPTVCTVAAGSPGLDINVLRSGTCTLTASQSGNSTYAEATDVTQSFVISLASQTISFDPTFPSVTYGDDPFSIAGTTTSDLVVAFSSTTPTVCTVTGDASLSNGATNAVVAPLTAGTCTIEAEQAGDDRYDEATTVSRSFTIAKAAQAALVFTSASTAVWGDDLTAAVSGGSGTMAVSFTAAAGTAGCTINATTGVVEFTSAGTCTLTADKAGDDNHLAATQVSQTLTITEAGQTVTFTSTVPERPLPGGTYTVTAEATSGLTPTLAITAGETTVCTLSSGVVTFLATGTCEITATQTGDNRFDAADTQTQTISVGSLNQTINVTIPDDVDYGAPGFTLDADTTSGLDVTVTPTDTDICSTTGLVITPVDIGDCELTITQAGNSRYAAASTVTISFRIRAAVPTAPTITSVSAGNTNATIGFTAPGFTGGVDLTAYTITATPTTGDPITDTTCTTSPCTITGLANGTEYTITVTANNAAGAGPASTSSPAITPATRATAVTTLAATPGNGTMRVTWGAPADFGGGTFTRYELRIAPDGESMPSAATATVTSSTTGSYTFTGLDNGVAYNVEIVTITTANQTSIEGNTATLSSVPVSTPAQPEALTVNEFSPRVVRITWSEPLRDGGAPVTGYTVTITDSDGTSVECGTITIEDSTRSADCTSDLLELSTSYSVTVAAVNRIGAGAVASATHTTPTFTAPSTPPTITTDDDDDTECPCIYDPDGNPVPVDVERSEPGVTPGSVTIGDGSSTVTIGGNSNDGDGQFWVDADGQLTVLPPAGVPFQGSGGLPGTTVTVFIDGVAVGTATVDDDGNWQVIIDLPTGTTGPIDATIVWVDTDGDQQTLNVPIGIYTPVTTPPDITTDDTDNCPCVFDADGNPVPVSTDTTPTGATPGRLTLGDGISTINLGTTTSGSGQATTWVGPDGNLVAQTPGTIPFTGTGALPGTTITVFIDGISVGTATVDEDGNWALNLDIPDGTNGPITITIIWTDETGQHRTLTTPITIIATGDAATAPRAPTTGTQLAPDPDTAIAIGPNGELLDSTRTTNTDTNTVTITVGDATLNITLAENGRLDATGRLVITHPARVRVTATGMLPDTTATIWVMSDPQRLGTTTIAADGTIDTTYAIPTGIDPGNHTIQIDTVNTTGEPISIALGLTITSGLLPTTGTNTNTHLAWLTLIIAIGALTTLTTTGNRRKQRPA